MKTDEDCLDGVCGLTDTSELVRINKLRKEQNMIRPKLKRIKWHDQTTTLHGENAYKLDRYLR